MNIDEIKNYPDQYEKIAQWFHEQWGYLHKGRTLSQVIEMLSQYEKSHTIPKLYGALEKGQIIGTIEICEDDMGAQFDFSPWLATVYVDKKWRRQGIGGCLVDFMIKKSGEMGFKKIYLYTPDQEKWYQKYGFILIDRPVYCGHKVSVMCRQI
jgi:N-acetylglutamate synthase-like GNAT family acetyltransferase